MAMVINTNALSLNAQNNLNKSQQSLNTAIERLSSGSRINSAKDDAAGLAISNRMGAQIAGLNQANRNANDGISMAQTAEGAMGQVTDNLQRIRELTVQAANGTNGADDLASIQDEIGQRLDEITRLSDQTEFNGQKLLGGDKFSDATARNGADAAVAGTRNVSIQVGANDKQTIELGLTAMDLTSLGMDGFSVSADGVDFSKGDGNDGLLQRIDDALQTVDSARSTLGAQQNRLQSVVEGNSTTSTNLSAAQSQIKDADYATEVSNMSKAQILQQAGTSVLAQANQTTQGVMSLLR
ncbi:flagellin [Kushneria avicenniae]|uniref:Flagellin n=1 Tax=Kushneria avicenniae TaxID=402385 RepID=A0A1I1FAI9_9GAMM|nr:flagellin [Kushneria avicenniae]SFB96489.1 flagellin [Kushneria avicenniae]